MTASSSRAPDGSSGRDTGRIRKALGFLALDPKHAVRDLSLGFSLGGVAVALNVGIYALAGWYQVQSVHLDLGPFLFGGLGGYFLVALYEEFLARGILFRGLEIVLGSIAALAISSLAFGLLHLGNPGATLLGAVTSAAAGGVVFGVAYMLTRSLWLAIGLHWAADFWQGSFFGLRPAGTTVSHPLLHSTLTGPQLWVGDRFGGRLVSLAIFVPIMVALLVMARRRGCFRPAPARLRRLVHARHQPGTTIERQDVPQPVGGQITEDQGRTATPPARVRRHRSTRETHVDANNTRNNKHHSPSAS